MQHPWAPVRRSLKRYHPSVSDGASIYLTAVLNYLCKEILDIAAQKQVRISEHRLRSVLRNDEELDRLTKSMDL